MVLCFAVIEECLSDVHNININLFFVNPLNVAGGFARKLEHVVRDGNYING